MIDTVSRVYELAEERKMTLYQLANVCHISFSTIRTTEKRGGQLKVDTIDRICAGLGITMSDFFQESEKTAVEKRTNETATNNLTCKVE